MIRRRLYRLRRGSWQPARLTSTDHMLILYALMIMPIVRAFDYSSGDDASASLTAVEGFAPMWAWAIFFYLGALVLAYGVRARRHLIVYIGHSILAVTYSALAVGVLATSLTRPWLDGVRGASVLILPTLMHWMIWWRTGPAPIKAGEAVTVEVVEGPR